MAQPMATESGAARSQERSERGPLLTQEEIDAVRVGVNGVKGVLPARFYYDEAMHRFEVEHILKKHWLYVGPWDWAAKPGDYFTINMLGEPLVIIRGKDNQVRALVNSCRHRYSAVVPEGRGNKNVLVCPYHHWSYNIDGSLRAISVEDIKEVDHKTCALPALRAEVWNGLIFINFDPNATSLAAELSGLDEILKEYNLGSFRYAGHTTYEANWNYKFSFETGNEAYHHAGVHVERIGTVMPPGSHRKLATGKTWGVYAYTTPEEFRGLEELRRPFGPVPWMSAERNADYSKDALFAAIFPNFISFIQPHQISSIATQVGTADRNIASTTISVAGWAWERPDAQQHIDAEVQFMREVQDEDTMACTMLQKGIRSSFNKRGVLHPKFEPMMSQYYNWLLDHYLGNAG
jgi:phenylpropionate dioxygenase-like ring-hydroxylating dioxygenase large terminal subunit